jgi:hypothetical protein
METDVPHFSHFLADSSELHFCKRFEKLEKLMHHSVSSNGTVHMIGEF